MSNLAVNTAEGTFYPVGGVGIQSIYEYFVGSKPSAQAKKTNSVCFIAPNGELQRPYRTFNRSFEETPQ